MLISRIPSGGGLKLGHRSMSETITSWARTIYSEDDGGYQLFHRLMRLNCLAPSCVVPSQPGLESFSKKSNEVGLFWSSISIKLDGLKMLEMRRPIVNFFCSR